MTDGPRHPEDEAAARLTVARRLHPGAAGHPSLDRLTQLAARLLGTASAQVTLAIEVSSMVGSYGVPRVLQGDKPLTESLCARTAVQGRPLAITDTASDPRSAGAAGVSAGLVGSFLGVPLAADDGTTVGALCVFDPAPRRWTQSDVGIVEALAGAASAELELAALARDFDASRARWDLAIASAGVGSFDWDLRTGQLSWDETLIEMFGYSDDDVFEENIEAFNARLHPDDVPAVSQALQHAIDTVGEYEAEYRVVLPDGRVRQVQARGRALGENGISDRVLGAAWDVTATRASKDHAARIVEAMPVAYLRVDPTFTVTAGNQLAERLLRVNRLDLVGRVLWQVVPEAVSARLDALCTQVLDTGLPVIDEVYLSEPIESWFEVRIWPDPPDVSVFFTDITARRTERALAEQVAAHDRGVAEALQDALLTHLPQPDGLELRARYVTPAHGDRVGGDWYDAVVQPNGATTVAVGDVVGHDINAAATMGQLRSMLRAFIWQADDTPASVLTRLDRAVHDLYPGTMATAVTARIEQDADAAARGVRLLRWTNGGHLPPVVLRRGGTTELLDAAPGVMLGVAVDRRRQDHVVELLPGDTVVLYTDGLVERRRDSIDAGIDRLTTALRRHHQLGAEQLIDAVLDELVDEGVDDDTVLFVVRMHGAG